jgi:phosphate transport system permease protein
MSSNIAPPTAPPPVSPPDSSTEPADRPAPRPRRRSSSHATLVAHGEPQLWLTGGALAISLVLVVGLLTLVVYQGIGTFWPRPVVELKLVDGAVLLGEIARSERYKPEASAFGSLPPAIAERARQDIADAGGFATRRLVRVGNFSVSMGR